MNPKFTITTWEPKECWWIAEGHEKDSGNILPMFVLDAGTKLLSEKQSFVRFACRDLCVDLEVYMKPALTSLENVLFLYLFSSGLCHLE